MRFALLPALLLSTAIALPASAQETDNVFRMHLKAPIYFTGGTPTTNDPDPIETPEVVQLTLGAHAFPSYSVGDAFNHDFKTLLEITGGNAADVDWSLGTPNELPVGFSSTGVASGNLTTAGEYDFEVVASHEDAESPARRVYTIVVDEAVVPMEFLASPQTINSNGSASSSPFSFSPGTAENVTFSILNQSDLSPAPNWISVSGSNVSATPPSALAAGEHGPYVLRARSHGMDDVISQPFRVLLAYASAATTLPTTTNIPNAYHATYIGSELTSNQLRSMLYDGIDAPVVRFKQHNMFYVASLDFDSQTLIDSCMVRIGGSFPLPDSVRVVLRNGNQVISNMLLTPTRINGVNVFSGTCSTEPSTPITQVRLSTSSSNQEMTLFEFRVGKGGVFRSN